MILLWVLQEQQYELAEKFYEKIVNFLAHDMSMEDRDKERQELVTIGL